MKPVLQKLGQDEDMDVKYFAQEAISGMHLFSARLGLVGVFPSCGSSGEWQCDEQGRRQGGKPLLCWACLVRDFLAPAGLGSTHW